MKHWVIFITLSLLLAACRSTAAPNTCPSGNEVTAIPLLQYVNVDLRGLDTETRQGLHEVIEQLVGVNSEIVIENSSEITLQGIVGCHVAAGESECSYSTMSNPWFIWQFDRDDKARYVMFEGFPLVMIPGASGASVYVFNEQWCLLSGVAFSTGWRIQLSDVEFKTEPILGTEVMEMRTSAAASGADIVRQVYGLLNDNLVLIRLEDSQGKAVANTYSYPNLTIGPRVANGSVASWKKALESKNPVEVLAALVWLSGGHLYPSQIENAQMEVSRQSVEEAEIIQALRDDRRVQRILKRLSDSENIWIAEVAELALEAEWDWSY